MHVTTWYELAIDRQTWRDEEAWFASAEGLTSQLGAELSPTGRFAKRAKNNNRKTITNKTENYN